MKNVWNISLGISIAIHTLLLISIPNINTEKKIKEENNVRELEIITPKELYDVNVDKLKKEQLSSKKPPPYVKEIIKKTLLTPQHEKTLKPEIKLKTKEILFSPFVELTQNEDTKDKVKKTPAYMEYYRLIREKIRKIACYYYNINKTGTVHLSFAIFKNGELAALKLLENSTVDKNLIEISLKSIKEASPFPPFPKELNKYSQLRFNVSIYFKNN